MPDFTKVNPGDGLSIPAAVWNAVQDSARDYLARRGGEAASGSLLSSIFPAVTVLVRNNTGSTLAYPGVLALGDPVISAVDEPQTVQQQPGFEGDVPAAATDVFAVVIESIEDGAFGRGVVQGVAVCDIDVTDTGHEFAAPTPGDETQLTSAASGPARIVWKDSGTGTKRAVVLLGGGGGGDCCEFSTDDYSTTEPLSSFKTADGFLSGSNPGYVLNVTPAGFATVDATAIRIPAGTGSVVIRASVWLGARMSGRGSPWSVSFTGNAALFARVMPPSDPGSGPFSLTVTPWLPVVAGQAVDPTGSSPTYTGDVIGAFFANALIWEKTATICRVLPKHPTLDIQIVWGVNCSYSLASGTFDTALSALGIGVGGTGITYDLLCCETTSSPATHPPLLPFFGRSMASGPAARERNRQSARQPRRRGGSKSASGISTDPGGA